MSITTERELTAEEQAFVAAAKAVDGLTLLTVRIRTSDGETFQEVESHCQVSRIDLSQHNRFLTLYGRPVIETCLHKLKAHA